MMAIAAETSVYRKYGFTGPNTFRWEAHVKVDDVAPPLYGDYSAGPMQILATTARWVIRAQHLNYKPFTASPVFGRSSAPPQSLPLYDPAINIDIGVAVIKQRMVKTGHDPILIAAAFNASGIYASDKNSWRLKTY